MEIEQFKHSLIHLRAIIKETKKISLKNQKQKNKRNNKNGIDSLETEIKEMKELKVEMIEDKSFRLLRDLNMEKGMEIEEIKEIELKQRA